MFEFVTIVQNLENNSLDFIMHKQMDSEELEKLVYDKLWIDLSEYNWQTYESEWFMQRHFILK